MKLNYSNIAGIVLLIALSSSTSYAQEQFTHTVTKLNKNCNQTCTVLDVPALNNNPTAIILVTPVVATGMNLNPHPIGAYFMYLKKWSIMNLDQTAIAEGATFKVQYFLTPGPNRFVYTVLRGGRGEIPCIDHAGLNDNPNAHIQVFPTASFTRGALYNVDDIKVEYDATARKWCVANINNKPVRSEVAYNIVIASGGAVASKAPPPSSPTPPISTPPSPRTSPPTQPTPIIPTTPAPLPSAKSQTTNSNQVALEALIDFVKNGLPASAAAPTEHPDQAAVGEKQGGSVPEAAVINGIPQGLFVGRSLLTGRAVCLLFLSGGRVTRSIPTGGLESFDWARHQANHPNDSGTWEIHGGHLTISWGPGGVVNQGPLTTKPDGIEFYGKRYARPGTVLVSALAGSWESVRGTAIMGGEGINSFSTLVIQADGRYRRTGSIGGISSDRAVSGGAEASVGKLTIKGSTIIFRRDNDTITSHTFVPVFGNPVGAFSIDSDMFIRER